MTEPVDQGSLGQALAAKDWGDRLKRQKKQDARMAKIKEEAARGRAYVAQQRQMELSRQSRLLHDQEIERRKQAPGLRGLFFTAVYTTGGKIESLLRLLDRL
jgi:chemotaxis response regulator CheB